MGQSQIITAEQWTVGSVIAGVLLLVAVIAAIVWAVLRYGGRGS
ncbi:MAG TPA: hypothetical protein VK011_00945 [Acidimicrobiia bacterium]|nr:hypothetical protein [Acidimicrobiia bacterium]